MISLYYMINWNRILILYYIFEYLVKIVFCFGEWFICKYFIKIGIYVIIFFFVFFKLIKMSFWLVSNFI